MKLLMKSLMFVGWAIAVSACGSGFTTQDGADLANHVNALDACENVAAKVKAEKCDGGTPCLEGYQAYEACKKDGGL